MPVRLTAEAAQALTAGGTSNVRLTAEATQVVYTPDAATSMVRVTAEAVQVLWTAPVSNVRFTATAVQVLHSVAQQSGPPARIVGFIG